MSAVNFDFYISQPDCVQALERYREMENRMEKEKKNIMHTIHKTKEYWIAYAKDAVKDKLKQQFNEGDFDITYQKIKAVGNCMEESLPAMNALLARCAGFAEQLQYNSYIEPNKPAAGDNTERNGGILALNYAYIPLITETCDAILEENDQITSILADVINDCRTLLDGTNEDMERLTLASNKIKRIGNYKESFLAYASGVQDLENNMRMLLRAVSNNDIAEKNKSSAKLINYEDLERGKTISELGFSVEEMDQFIESASTDTDVKMMQALLSGNYADAFMCDPAELSEETKVSFTIIVNRIVVKGSCQQAEEFINALLHTDAQRCGAQGNNNVHDYLNILSDTSLLLLSYEVEVCQPVLNDQITPDELDTLEQEWRNLYVLHGLWNTLEMTTRSEYFHNLDSNYYDGTYSFRISGLKINTPLSDMEFELGVYQGDELTVHMNGGEFPEEQKQLISVHSAERPGEVNIELSVKNYQKLYEKMDLEKAEALFDAAVSCVGFIPGAEGALKGLQSFYKGDMGGVLDNMGEIPMKGGIVFKIMGSIYKYNQCEGNYQKEKSKQNVENIIRVMGSGVYSKVAGKREDISYGIYDPHVWVKLNIWSEKGMCGYLGIDGYSPEELKELVQEMKYKDVDDEELKVCLDILIYGSDNIKIYELDPGVLFEAFQYINEKMPMIQDNPIADKLRGHSCTDFLYK